MTYLDTYVTTTNRVVGLGGEAPEDGTWSGSPVPWFPPDHGYGTAFFAIRDGVQSGRFEGVQVDWGSWAARMTRAEIEQFLEEIYGPAGEYEAKEPEHLAEKMRTLRRVVANLVPGRHYAVVCEEF